MPSERFAAPTGRKVTRIAFIANSRPGESKESFMQRVTSGGVMFGGRALEPAGEPYRKGDKWAVKCVEWNDGDPEIKPRVVEHPKVRSFIATAEPGASKPAFAKALRAAGFDVVGGHYWQEDGRLKARVYNHREMDALIRQKR